MRTVTTLLLVLVVAVILPVRAQVAQKHPAPPVARAVFTEQPPVVDGDLGDAVWQGIAPITDFRQRDPVEGAAPTERTELRIAYDADNLYFALTLFDEEPQKIRANIFERGGRIDKDDRILLALDTYLDRRNAYLFEMNPLGTQDDALLTDEASLNWDWDGVYVSEGRVTDFGWTLEIAIPFTTIRFSEDEAPQMGVAIMRTINRKNETAIWPFIGRDYRMGILQVSRYATLTGLQNLRRGHHLQVKPYVLTGAQKVDGAAGTQSDLVRQVGGELKYGITSNVTLDLTVNTDFAQVESDAVQVNLTRFNLFYPEKREFFLERAGLFAFGTEQQAETFFSRRIGITNDILAGARFTGQQGPLSVGLLNIQTEREDGVAGANYGVARVRADVLARTTVGAIFTNLQHPEAYNRALGADAAVRFWRSSELKAWYTRVWDDAFDDAAGSVALDLRSDRYSLELAYLNVGERFQPGIGFVRRLDQIRYEAEVGFRPRFGDGRGPVRQLQVALTGDYVEGQDHEKQTTAVGAEGVVIFRARDHAGIEVERQFDRLETPFAIRSDAVIPAADYTFDTVTLSGATDPGRRAFAEASLQYGSFYDGTRGRVGGTLGFRFSKHLKMEGTVDYNRIALPIANGDFDATTLGLRIGAATSRKLFASALIQYDNFSKDLQANIRVNWIHTPGSDLFLVFNTSYFLEEDVLDPRSARLNNRAGVAKVTYLLSL